MPGLALDTSALGRVLLGEPGVEVAPWPVEAVDSTGAGDAFAGALCAGLASGRSLDEATVGAAAAGALATRAVGARASLATKEELEAAVAGRAAQPSPSTLRTS